MCMCVCVCVCVCVCDTVKMHPPGMPNVSRSPNETQISWSLGRPTAIFLKVLDFEVEIKQKHQKWEEALTLSTQKQEVRIRRGKLKRHCQARVRVKPNELYTSHWSDWSSTTSWQEAEDVEEPSQNQEEFRTLIVTWGVVGSLVLILVVMLVLCRSCLSRGLYKKKPVPNPSRYFHSLYSVHEGNLKKWMNPLTASESFFMAHPADQISPVELCGSPDVDPSTSPSVATSTSALLSFKGHPSAGTNTSGVLDKSSSTSSSSFSNMGYFMSSSSRGSAPSNPGRAYFTYQGDIRTPNNSRVLCLSLCPTFNTSPAYESLKGEPQSPDSGFGVGKEDEEKVVGVKEEKDSDHSPALIILPLHLPSQLFPPSSSPPPSPNAPILTPVSTDSFQVDEPVEAGAGSYAAWPLAGAVCRSSSMPVESGKTGYLTLKELQTSFSNKSI
ncbi:interleukin-2 receptor subunit beta-like [Xyrichtys novacula]|uniref:Interleukin-2 receptor subunit beta-like n=1 Tax=Xyrichtys novacula TaxID=13765 RepID=A0AAV1GTR6_XYRNO|nr:interleukin-2 receptor subunit beta-like [Xyrichtys novacula]